MTLATIHTLPTERAVDEAWEAFSAHSRRLTLDGSLILDRAYMNEFYRLEDRYRQLYLRWAR